MGRVPGYDEDVPHRYIEGSWNPGWCELCDHTDDEHTSSEEEIAANIEAARKRWSGSADAIK